MTKLSINVLKHRLDFILSKRRNSQSESIIPNLGEIKRARKGNMISRFFRHVFEHASIKKLLGSALTFTFLAGAFVPESLIADNQIIFNAQVQKPVQINATAATPALPQTSKKLVFKQPEVLSMAIAGSRYPLDSVKISQRYSYFHQAIDLAEPVGTPVFSILPGKVEAVQYYRKAQDPTIGSTLYGNAIIINHGGGITSLYAHLSKINVSVGQEVTTSTVIGEVGSTGRATGPHLHLEVRQGDKQINPLTVVK